MYDLDTALELALWCLGTYLLAAVPVGLLIGRIRGIDLRAIGSGNIGATNAVRALGKNWGLPVFALDVLKGVIPAWLATESTGIAAHEMPALSTALIGFSALMGHNYPVYLRFRGGKGVACALGVYCVFCPVAGAVALVLYVQTLWLTGISAVGSLTGVSAMTLFVVTADLPTPHRVMVVIMAAIIWYRHRSNLAELRIWRQRERSHRAELQARSDPSA